MKCHYEVLEVSKDADDLEIKTAYRKLALKWHPDKNLENTEYAKEQFQIVQQAYEVLSDRQERAWYDNHREQIIRGACSDFEDRSLDVFQYFTATCFKGYGNDDNGFYAVYRNVFETLAKEDMEFMDHEEYCEIPNFGNSETDFDKVSEFYAFWLNYTTKKSYVWLDPYDIKDIRERRYLKLVEKENKKIRQKAKKERNEEVRNLALFVKKRDKRIQNQKKLQEQKLLEDKKKRESWSKQKRLERQIELANDSNQPEWSKFENFKSQLEEIEKNLVEQFGDELSNSDSEENDDDDDLYCTACSKLFKTPKAFQNHETSKKHKDNVEIMKKAALEDSIESEEIDEYNSVDNSEGELNEIFLDTDLPNTVRKNKKKKKRQGVITVEEPVESQMKTEDVDFKFFEDDKPKKKNKKNSKPKPNAQTATSENSKLCQEDSTNGMNSQKADQKGKKEKSSKNIQEIDLDHNCVMCKSNFSSKNKLFAHLKKTGHGVYIPPNVKNGSSKMHLKTDNL